MLYFCWSETYSRRYFKLLKDHVTNFMVYQFSIPRKCKSDFECKISEEVLIRKLKPKVNEILYRNCVIYILKIFNWSYFWGGCIMFVVSFKGLLIWDLSRRFYYSQFSSSRGHVSSDSAVIRSSWCLVSVIFASYSYFTLFLQYILFSKEKKRYLQFEILFNFKSTSKHSCFYNIRYSLCSNEIFTFLSDRPL